MNFREFLSEVKKSDAASYMLQMMDDDVDYKKALNSALKKFPNINKAQLEDELNKYI